MRKRAKTTHQIKNASCDEDAETTLINHNAAVAIVNHVRGVLNQFSHTSKDQDCALAMLSTE